MLTENERELIRLAKDLDSVQIGAVAIFAQDLKKGIDAVAAAYHAAEYLEESGRAEDARRIIDEYIPKLEKRK